MKKTVTLSKSDFDFVCLTMAQTERNVDAANPLPKGEERREARRRARHHPLEEDPGGDRGADPMSKRVYHNHLVRNVPNNFFTRWLVRLFVAAMARSDSRWTLELKYRRPRKGYRYSMAGGIVRDGRPPVPFATREDWEAFQKPMHRRAKRFSIYARLRSGPAKAESVARVHDRQEAYNRGRADERRAAEARAA